METPKRVPSESSSKSAYPDVGERVRLPRVSEKRAAHPALKKSEGRGWKVGYTPKKKEENFTELSLLEMGKHKEDHKTD